MADEWNSHTFKIKKSYTFDQLTEFKLIVQITEAYIDVGRIYFRGGLANPCFTEIMLVAIITIFIDFDRLFFYNEKSVLMKSAQSNNVANRLNFSKSIKNTSFSIVS